MTLTFTILGCGSSGGVPRPALGWGACNPDNPKNRRRRCSLLVERRLAGGKTSVLIDTSPDLREQLLSAGVEHLDAVLVTHEHADHTHGIDDLRPLFMRWQKRLDVYLDEATAAIMHQRFGYCFVRPPGSGYPPIANEQRLTPMQPVAVTGAGGPIRALPIVHYHGDIPALGFRFGDVAYSPDLNGMPAESAAALEGLELWIVDALRHNPHPSHFTVAEALTWIERLAPRRAILTNLHSDLDYEALCASVPENVAIAYDGMQFSVESA